MELGPHINVFVGPNGQGKTNFLESLYICCRGKSFRAPTLKHVIQNGKEGFRIKALLQHEKFQYSLDFRAGESGRLILLNEKKITTTRLAELLPVVLFSPESLQCIKEGPEQRRKLIDDMIILFDARNAKIISEYEHVHKTKNKLLRNYVDGSTSRSETLALLESLKPLFLEKATDLTFVRLQAIRELSETFKNTFKSILNQPSVDISVDYVISDNTALNSTRSQIYETLHQRTLDLGVRELESGLCLVGPHRHEIVFVYNGNDSRFFCSQGQQRAIILSFKIAQVLFHLKVKETAPVLLLDDVLSELDSDRRDYLIRFLRENNAQTVVTTTDLAFCADLRTERLLEFFVHEGQMNRRN